MKLIKITLTSLLLISLTTAISASITPKIGLSSTIIKTEDASSSITQSGGGLVIGLSSDRLIKEKIEYYWEGYYILPTEIDSMDIELDNVKISGTPVNQESFSALGFKIGLRKIFNSFFINGGLNYTSLDYEWESGTGVSLDAKGGLGFHLGLGWKNENLICALEFKRLGSKVTGATENYEYNEGSIDNAELSIGYTF